MRANPRDWSIDDLKAMAREFAVEWRHPGTSHVTFSRAGHAPMTVPSRKPIKPIYVREFVRMLDAIGDENA